jgi:hypothetical protein
MASLSSKIKQYVNAEVDFTSDVLLQNDSDGKGDYIKEWNLDIAKPTDAQLDALETEANVNEQELKDAETQKETDASNGKQKLKDLGLTDAEIKALIG